MSAKVTHKATSVASMQHPTKGFSKVITRIKDSRDVAEDYPFGFFPILNGKPLYLDVSSTVSRLAGIDNLYRGFVVNVKWN